MIYEGRLFYYIFILWSLDPMTKNFALVQYLHSSLSTNKKNNEEKSELEWGRDFE